MEENKNNWKSAFSLFSEISTWVVVPIILALVLGKYLDGYFHTAPFIFLGFAAFGFLITIFGIVKVVGKYMKEIKDIENDGPDQKIEDPRQSREK